MAQDSLDPGCYFIIILYNFAYLFGIDDEIIFMNNFLLVRTSLKKIGKHMSVNK